MSEIPGFAGDRKVALKSLIGRLHQGLDPEIAKQQFAALLSSVTPEEIARLEEELVREGLPRQELQRLCDVHLAVFKESLEREGSTAPEELPVDILRKEHELLLQLAGDLKTAATALAVASSPGALSAALERIDQIVRQFKASENHYLREENVLFPYLEKHGVVQPPAIMWSEHDQIRAIKKELYEAAEGAQGGDPRRFGMPLESAAAALADMLASHFYKENNILFPTAERLLTREEWESTWEQFAELGYWQVKPRREHAPASKSKSATASSDGEIIFDTGPLPIRVVEAILNTLPVELTFVDAEDTVRYFSQPKERIFPRLKAAIGRKVQQCHPQKSYHLVNQILEDFRAGRRDEAEFWIQAEGAFLHIRFFAVRDRGGEYLGCLEVTQNVAGIQQLEGEKRLL